MDSNKIWYKHEATDKIYWLDNGDEQKGVFIFSFDKKTEFNLFADYPYKLTADQLKLFNEENPFCANFFSKRLKEVAK